VVTELRVQIEQARRELGIAERAGSARQVQIRQARVDDLIEIAARYGIEVSTGTDSTLRPPSTPHSDGHSRAAAAAGAGPDQGGGAIRAGMRRPPAPQRPALAPTVADHAQQNHRNEGDHEPMTSLPNDEHDVPDDNSEQWIDRLVELRVLAEHGDTASARAAQRWIATDDRARHLWEHLALTSTHAIA
jgi:hypothetical protein